MNEGLKNELLSKGKFFAKGKRSNVYLTYWKRKKVCIKVERKDTYAKGRIKNEADWLVALNKRGIGPNLLFGDEDFIIYEFVEGERITDWCEKASKEKIIKVLKEILRQCRVMDVLGVDKEELHRPVKHILVKEKPLKAVMIDFERCHFSLKPKNVTQFCQFLTSSQFYDVLNKKGIVLNKARIVGCLKNYKRSYGEKDFRKVLRILKLE